jgi:ribonucleotide reductase, class II
MVGDSSMALVSALTDKLTNGNSKNHSDSDVDLLTLADPALMRVVKREGNIVPYDKNKILRAVGLCFGSVVERVGGITPENVTDQVDTILRLKSLQLSEDGHLAEVGIEAIQDIVEAQLMALGQFDAAKHYILYRDERRRVREESRGVSPEMRDFFKAGCATFTGTNRLLQEVQAFDKFSRFRRDFTPKRRETWPDSCSRVMGFYRWHINRVAPGSVPEEIWGVMHDYLLHHKATGSMRGVQMAGPALERCNLGCFNCSYVIMDSPESMAEDLYLLMSGVGVGFSVEEEYAVDKWPRVHAKRDCAPVDYTVEDDTEAWCDAIKFGLYHWLDGVDVNFDLSLIRPAGSILKTKGGRASGPLPLRDLLNFDRDLIFRRHHKRLRSIDLLDMTCMLHRVGQMGGVRRASGLSLSDKDDLLMRDAKKGEFFNTHPWRNQANNSAVYEEKPTSMDFMDEWLALAKSGAGERGIFNRGGLVYQMPSRRARGYVMGTNPSLRKGTRVYTTIGIFPIEELEGKSFNVRNLNGKDSLATCFLSGKDQPLYKVILSTGMSYFATAEHKWPVLLRDGTIEKRETVNLGNGDYLPVVKVRELGFGTKWTRDEGFLAGWILGDGWINIRNDGYQRIGVIVSQEDIANDIDKKLERIIYNLTGSTATFNEDKESGCYVLDTSNKKFNDWAAEIGLNGKKFGLPDRVWNEASEDFRRGLIDGLFSSDGGVDRTRYHGSVFPEFSMKWECLADDLMELLGFYGIKTTKSRFSANGKRFPKNKTYAKIYTWYKVRMESNTSIQHFIDLFEITHEDKKSWLKLFSKLRLKESRLGSCVRIKSVEKTDLREDVWDISVFDDTHCFALSQCITGNCGEIILRNRELCNLSIAIVGVDDTYEEIEKKVEIATIWGTIQASMTNFRYVNLEWKKNCEEEALLGVDILGHMDCKLLRPGAPGREEILRKLLKKVQETNVYWAHRLGINPGAALTCGKPSGDSSVFFDKPAGFKPHHGRFYLRRLRFEETNPIANVLKDAKIPWQYDYDKTGMCVFEFPCRAPDDAIILGDMTVVEQLENWKTWKINFTEHNPSVTVSVKDHEWIEAGNWVYQNWDIVGGISFFPYDDSIYPLTPYQTITEQEYVQRAQVMPTEIDWSRILLYEKEDETTLSAQLACTGPGCEI